MQNSDPISGTMPVVDPSSWNLSPNRVFSPRSADSYPSHDAAMSRRRNAQTCDMCYKKKTKCELEGSNPACIQCMRRNTKCKFTMRREKRGNLKRSQYVKELEERVSRTESLLKAAGLLDENSNYDEFANGEGEQLESDSEREHENENDQSSPNWKAKLNRERTRRNASLGQNPGSAPTTGNSHQNSFLPVARNHPASGIERRRSLPGSSNIQHVPVLSFDGREESRYYGRSSSLSILSREGIEWIKEKTGDVKFVNYLLSQSSRDSPWDYWRPDVFHDLFDSHVFKPLPSRTEVFSLLKDYFRTVNRLFPLYNEDTFMRLVEWQYTQQTCDDAARWASINILLSLAYEYRFSNSLKPEKDRERAWLYFKNAMSVFAELTLRRTDILSVQALLGMALFLRGNSGTQSALPIITAAMGACHRMGLHRNLPRPYLPPVEQEQRNRVFWVAYILDQSTCGRSGSAPTQHIDDFDVDLPVEEIDVGCPAGSHSSFFRHLCRLTIIKGRIYCRLYSTKALNNKPVAEIFQIIDELHSELEEWKKDSAVDVQLKLKPAGEDFLFGFGSAGLRFVYYNSLIMIHRIPLIVHFVHARYMSRERQKTSDLRRIADQSAASSTICVQAARDTLKLVNNLPWGDIAWIWSLLYYVFLAVITIFANFMQDSTHPKAREDINTLNMASTFFRTLIPGDGPHKYAQFMAQMSVNFERIARAVFEKNEKAMKNRDEHATHDHATMAPMQEPDDTAASPSSVVEPGQDSSGFTASIHSVAPSVNISHGIMSEDANTKSNNAYPSGAADVPQGVSAKPHYAPATTAIPNNTHPSITDTATPIPRIYNTNANTNDFFPSIHPTPATTTTATATNDDIYPFSGFDNIAPPPPGLFHIPLAADWEFPNPFMEGIRAGTNMNTNASATAGAGAGAGGGAGANVPGYPLDLSGAAGTGFGAATSATATAAPAPPIDSNMVYDYADQVTQAPGHTQVPMVDTNLAWFGAFF